jgi:hypothetical protein
MINVPFPGDPESAIQARAEAVKQKYGANFLVAQAHLGSIICPFGRTDSHLSPSVH